MAVFGGYKDKSRSLELQTSLVDISVGDHELATTSYISTSPTDDAFIDVGEWVVIGADGKASRINATTGTVKVAGDAHDDNALKIPKLVWSERGAKDIQLLSKIPVLEGGNALKARTLMWVCQTTIVAGDELCVTFNLGSDWTVSGSGYSGVKGVVCPALQSSLGNGGGVYGQHASAEAWIVGLARNTVTATGDWLEMDLYPVPIFKSLF